jgi:tetratricopeptide (TPR) repeat protein
VKKWIASLAGTALFLTPAIAPASDESDVLRSRAVRLIRRGDCDSALPLLQSSVAADPREARAGLLAGRCLITQQRYADAEAALAEAGARDPGLKGVQLPLAVARYHQDDLAGARTALEAARPESAGDAQFELYDALVLMGEERRSEALLALERARSADPAAVEPLASYFEGVAASGQGDSGRARGALERVAAADAGGPWGTRAQRHLDQMGRGLRSSRWFELMGGVEWDSNAALRGDGVQLPNGASVVDRIDREGDTRMVWRANGGIEALRTLDWSAGGMLTYSGSGAHDSEQFNFHYPVGSLWVDRHLSERTTVHMQYDGGYAWSDSESWFDSHNIAPALYHDWGNGHQTRLFGRYYLLDYRFDRRDEFGETAAEAEYRDRDGWGLATGVEHVIRVNTLASDLYAGVQGVKYKARGPEYSNRAVDGWVGTRSRLPAEFFLTARAGFAYRPFANHTSFADPSDGIPNAERKRRRDHVKHFEIGIERALTTRTSAALRWSWVDNLSSVDVFDYDRSILGGYFTVRFE